MTFYILMYVFYGSLSRLRLSYTATKKISLRSKQTATFTPECKNAHVGKMLRLHVKEIKSEPLASELYSIPNNINRQWIEQVESEHPFNTVGKFPRICMGH